MFDYLRQRVEVMPRPFGESAGSVPIQGAVTTSGTVSISDQTAIGGINAKDQMTAMTHMAASPLRNNITVS
jgi:hypothetical protein